ncbi:MAG TPA: DUF1015 domain-containing protein [Candidatus Binatia bacterium]
MAKIASFKGILYNQKKIANPSRVVAPPYDVITPEEQEKLYSRSPYNIVRLILSREPEPYESAARLFDEWQREGILTRDEKPAIYFLTQSYAYKGEKERKGFMAVTRIEDFSSGAIRPHEATLAAPKEDRLRLMLACNANLSPIFALYNEPRQMINRLLAEHVQGKPADVEVKEDKGGSCRLWRITDAELIRMAEREMEPQPLLIADGHHRYEAAMNYRERMRQQTPNFNGREAFNYVMMVFANMKDEGVTILPTHRLVRSFAPIGFRELEESLMRYFYIEPYPKNPEGQRSFLRALQSGRKKHRLIGAAFKRDPRYLILRLKNKRFMQRLAGDLSAPLQELDVSVLHRLILDHILGIKPEDQVKEGAITYSQDEEKVLQMLDKEDYMAAFILNPTQPEEILAVTAAGEKMPQKTTYFYPKLIDGLVMNRLDPVEEIAEN